VKYLEDIRVGDVATSPEILVTEADALEFARRFDPQPMHTDPEAAQRGPFGGLIASGWHTAALMMRMMADANLLGGGDVLGLGVDRMTWPRPVRPGDVLHGKIEIGSIRPSKSNPDFGIVRMDVTVLNQHGETVMTASPNCWVPRRPAAAK